MGDLEKTECQHGIGADLMCIRCRELMTRRQIDILRGDTSRTAEHLLDMYHHDLKLFAEMLAKGLTVL